MTDRELLTATLISTPINVIIIAIGIWINDVQMRKLRDYIANGFKDPKQRK